MIRLQNPIIPAPTQAVEIDRAIYELQTLLDTNLNWLTHSYGRAYRHIEKKELRLYFPEVYVGGDTYEYHRVTPDNEKKGMCFFVVGKEENKEYEQHQHNYLKWNVGIVFWVNLALINKNLLQNEIFTQNLIKDTRHVLTHNGGGLSFAYKLKTVERELKEIYREFNIREEEEYLRAPYSGFRFNLEITLQEECDGFTYDPAQALINNLSKAEKLHILSSLDFTDTQVFGALTQQQKTDLQGLL